ncbi:MAG: FAD-dependent oxidoreductase, partial [Myxococcaceae bacterium]|nr:FAD-dependent oxidoreductase [Myxococcaceae bacterium]
GLEEVQVARYGYAVEYDFAPPTQLLPTLEARRVRGLFLAGQLNGTSGYEEAAVQGFLAGVNTALALRDEPALVLGRDEAHTGVLVDELVRRGVDEPFRMLTSRSEHRLRLREGNAGVRLLPHARRLGLLSAEELARTEAFGRAVDAEVERLRRTGLAARLKRPEGHWVDLRAEGQVPADVEEAVGEEAEVLLKYEGYIAQATRAARREAEAWDGWRIPEGLAFDDVRGLSAEAAERLARARPATVGQARALPGLTPAALSLLLVHLERLRREAT